MTETVIVTEIVNDVVISTSGAQGPAGRTILNGSGAPSNNLGVSGDFYVNNDTHQFYGPKLSDTTWSGANVITLVQSGSSYAYNDSWEINELSGPTNGVYSIEITHNLGFYPNATIRSSSGDLVETGIDYNSINKITLTMAQPFAGTVYLS